MKNPSFSLSVQYAVEEEEPPPRPRVRALVRAALATAAVNSGEFAVRFVGTAESAALNRHHRGGDGATNVLSFAYSDAAAIPSIPGDSGMSGDIIVCCPLVRREARRYQLPVASRYAHLIVHGVLHVLGHRHDTSEAAAQMETLEKRILARFGVSDPYRENEGEKRA